MGFPNLSAPALGRGGGGLGGSTEDMVTIPFSQCFMVSICGGVGRFVPMIMVVERGDTTGAFGLFQILVSCSQFRYVVMCINLVKMIVNTCRLFVRWLKIIRKLY
jgi:hypothetical protein